MRKMIGSAIIILFFVLYTLNEVINLCALSGQMNRSWNSIYDKLREIDGQSWKPYCKEVITDQKRGVREYHFDDYDIWAYVLDYYEYGSRVGDAENEVYCVIKLGDNVRIYKELDSSQIIAKFVFFSEDKKEVLSVKEYLYNCVDGQYYLPEKPQYSFYAEKLVRYEQEFLEKIPFAESTYQEYLKLQYDKSFRKTLKKEVLLTIGTMSLLLFINKRKVNE